MDDDNAAAVTALALTECILAELTARLGLDFGLAVEQRMIEYIDTRKKGPHPVDALHVEALYEGMAMIEWKRITGRHPFPDASG